MSRIATTLRETASRICGLFAKRHVDADLEDEFAAHLDLLTEENIRRGMPRKEAHYAARREFGRVEQIKQTYRERRGLPMLETFLHDLRYGARMLVKNPGFTAIAVLTLALGIGANTAIFSVVNSLLLTPPHYKQPDRLVMVWEQRPSGNWFQGTVSPANYFQWQDHNTVFEQMAVMYDDHLTLTGDNSDPEQIAYQGVSSNLLSMLGTDPIIGRTFFPEDAVPRKNDVVILSFGLWQRRFGGDSQIVGKKIEIEGQPCRVIGVMPRGFQLFIKRGSFTSEQAEIWTPIPFTEKSRVPRGRYLTAVARLKPGVTIGQAQLQMDSIAVALEKQWPDFDKGWGVKLIPLKDQLVGNLRQPLLILLGAVAFVLLMGCTNVANLLLGRAAGRQREIAVRVALGADRKRVIRQLLTESLLLSALGGIAGLLLAIWGTKALLALGPKNMLAGTPVIVDWRVLAFTTTVSLATGILFGLGPSLVALSADVNKTLKEGGRDASSGRRGNRLRSALVIAELTLAVVILVGAGLCLRSFYFLNSVDPGFNPHNLLTMKLSLPNASYKEDAKKIAFFQQLRDRTAALPGVISASADSWLPFTTMGAATGFQIEGQPQLSSSDQPVTDVRVVEPDYFHTMAIPLIAGREFNEQEASVPSHVIIITQALATGYFHGESPIGKRITVAMGGNTEKFPSLIVGVVGDVKHEGLNTIAGPMVYWPHPELPFPFMTFVIRTTGNPLALIGSVRQAVKQLDPGLPVSDVATMEQRMSDSAAESRFSTLLLGIFAVVAIVLATVGIYGVTSYAVTARQHEIGIRMAVGAQPADVERMFIRRGIALTLTGLALGLIASFALTRLMGGLLFGVTPHDPLTFVAMAALLLIVAMLACYIPARRATRVDPLVALRYE
ncbi:MAG TPA: ABC transporter permease [Candidatus Acidoferrales bacterium]